MKFDPKSIARKALALLAIGALGAALIGGPDAGLGFILGGLLMIGSFGMGWLMTRPAEDGSFSQRRFGSLITFKFPLVGFLGWVLLSNFPPVAVAFGGMVFVFTLSLDAALTPHSSDHPKTANTTGYT